MRAILIPCAIAIALAAGTPAGAQDLMRDMQRECLADAKKLCSTKIGNPNELIQCLVDKRAQLVPGCQPVVDRAARALSITPSPQEAASPSAERSAPSETPNNSDK